VVINWHRHGASFTLSVWLRKVVSKPVCVSIIIWKCEMDTALPLRWSNMCCNGCCEIRCILCQMAAAERASEMLCFFNQNETTKNAPHVLFVYVLTHLMPHINNTDIFLNSWKFHFVFSFIIIYLRFIIFTGGKEYFWKISASICNNTSIAQIVSKSTANQKAALLEIATVDLSSNQNSVSLYWKLLVNK